MINPEEITTYLETEANKEMQARESQIRNAQFQLEDARRRKAQAESELASIPNRGRFGHAKDDYELLAEKHLTEAEADIAKWELKSSQLSN